MSTLVHSKRLHLTETAYKYVHEAHERLKLAGAVDAAARVKATLNSVRGAVRHAVSLDHLGDEDRELRTRRTRPKLTAEQLTKAPIALRRIQQCMSGREWNADTTDAIAEILRECGLPVKDYRDTIEGGHDNTAYLR